MNSITRSNNPFPPVSSIFHHTISILNDLSNIMRLVLLLVLYNSQLVFGCAHAESATCPTLPGNNSHDSVVALILARGGSRGIPLKNLAVIDGHRTLLSRALHTVLGSGVFQSIWVSTEDDRIAEAVEREFPNSSDVRVHRRPMEVALDHTSSIESVRQFLDQHAWAQNVALVQCTSPFLRVEYLREALRRFRLMDADCVFSVTRSFKLRWKIGIDGKVVALNFDPGRRPRRQDWNGELVETGMFYFAKRKLTLEGYFQNDNCEVVVIDDKDAMEIDTPYDLWLARKILE
ncbi:N-acylneuraminate cytidylyltransferase-like [Armigeres subalbatus]|uniref:N-acylneuraminate cytidylyltransferase-like n=1 Tax=Armigeres subalbatus TaxID=124917 RepID=UPI002ED032DA